MSEPKKPSAIGTILYPGIESARTGNWAALAYFALAIVTENPLFIVAGYSQLLGTALAPTPPREKTYRDSPTYGIDKFENPRGPEAHVAILYGEHKVKPVCISESVASISENNDPGSNVQQRQAVKWLGVICEGEIEAPTEIQINDRDVLSELRENERLGAGNGTRKDFAFPRRWVYLGDEESPAVRVFVDGVERSATKRSATAEFTMPATAYKSMDVTRDSKAERVVEKGVRLYIRGPGYAERQQLKRAGVFRWTVQKLRPWKLRITFQTRPPAGFTVRVAYDYLAADGLSITQDVNGNTTATFARPVSTGAKVTATYRTTPFPGLRIRWRSGTLDQSPIPGFTDFEQSRNPRESVMTRDAPLTYDTAAREVDDLRVLISAPRGFIHYDETGGHGGVQAHVRIEYRKAGATKWVILRSSSGDFHHLVGHKSTTVRWEIGISDELERAVLRGDAAALTAFAEFDRAAYEVRVTRLTPLSSNDLVVDELSFAAVTEIRREGFSYPGTALLGLYAMPTDFLSGGSLRVSCKVRRAALYDSREAAGDARDIGSSQNHALAIRDLLTSAEGEASERYGGGYFFGAGDLAGADDPDELNGLAAFADFCDEWVHRPGDDATKPASATNGERRCRLNMVLDTPSSLMEAAADIAFLGYCFLVAQGARWRFPLDQEGDPVFTFQDDVDPATANMSDFQLRLEEWGKTPSAVAGSFWSEDLKFERDDLLWPVADVPVATPVNVREVDLRGCTRSTEAARMLRHLAEQAKASPFPCSWSAHPGVQHIEAGDIVTVRTRVPFSVGTPALELRVRVLSQVVSRDEAGKLTVRYAGRVMSSQVYALKPVTVPKTAPKKIVATGAGRRAVTALKARVQ